MTGGYKSSHLFVDGSSEFRIGAVRAADMGKVRFGCGMGGYETVYHLLESFSRSERAANRTHFARLIELSAQRLESAFS